MKRSIRAIIVRLSIDTHKALRIRVAEQDTSIQKWVESLVERELKPEYHEREEETAQEREPGQ